MATTAKVPEAEVTSSRDSIWPIDVVNINTGLPLEGLRVLDLSRVLAGPLCAMIAGDLGADVIKVEAPRGDPVRELAPPSYGEDATYYLAVNRHRRNVVADLRDSKDFARVAELASAADAVVENFLPSQSAALGIDGLRASLPDCVWITVSSAATGGPLSNEPTFDLLAQARSGIMSVTGNANSEPTKVGAPVADVVTGLYGAVGLLCGLFARATGRPGRHFEAPLLESAITVLTNQAQGYLITGVVPQRLGNHHPSIAPYGPVRTSDGYLLLAVATDLQFAKLLKVLNRNPKADASVWDRFAVNAERVNWRDDLHQMLDTYFEHRSTNKWIELLTGSGVPHAPILDVAGALSQPQVATGDLLAVTDAPAGPMTQLRSPLRIDGQRPPIRKGPRRLGEDDNTLGF